AELARPYVHELEARTHRAGGGRQVAARPGHGRALASLGLDIGGVHDVGGAFRRAGGRLPLPRRGLLADVRPRRPDPGNAGAGEPCARPERPLAEGQDVEAVGPRAERVQLADGDVDDAVARADLVRPRLARALVLPGEARAAEDVED